MRIKPLKWREGENNTHDTRVYSNDSFRVVFFEIIPDYDNRYALYYEEFWIGNYASVEDAKARAELFIKTMVEALVHED